MLSIFDDIEADNKKENFYPIDNLLSNDDFNKYINNESEVLVIDYKINNDMHNVNKINISKIFFDSKNYFLSINEKEIKAIKFLKIRKETFKRIYSFCFNTK